MRDRVGFSACVISAREALAIFLIATRASSKTFWQLTSGTNGPLLCRSIGF